MKKLFTITLSLLIITSFSQEICTNGIDDDNDGLIDLFDSECMCQSIPSEPISLIANPSFEEFNCCPTSFSQLSCANTWVQASSATSDFFHTCGYSFPAIYTSNFFPFPDGDGIAGFIVKQDYMEYIGACLLSPMLAGVSYTIQFDLGSFVVDGFGENINSGLNLSDLELTFYGAELCGNIPFIGNECPPSSVFSVLGSTSINFGADYQVVTVSFVPSVDINEIIIGAPCTIPPDYPDYFDSDNNPYFLIDNIVVNESSSFGTNFIIKSGNICTDNVKLYGNPSETGGAFQWFNDGIAIIGQTTDSLLVSQLNLDDGLYQLMYSLDGECVVDTIIVNPFKPIILNALDKNICLGGTIDLEVSGASSYIWSPNSYLSSSSGNIVTATPSSNITYKIVGSDLDGCKDSTTLNLTVTPLNILVNDAFACFKGQEVILSASGAQNYTWSPVSGLINSTGSEVSVIVDSTIIYTVIGEENGCYGEAKSTVYFESNLDFSVNFSPNPIKIFNPEVLFSANSIESLSFDWEFYNIKLSDTNNFTYRFPSIDTSYTIVVIAKSEKGCIDSLITKIKIIFPSEFYIPNSFSPNGDELNNTFKPIYYSETIPKDYRLSIYNRWGELIFESFNLSYGWDGTFKDKIVQTGTYFYRVDYVNEIDNENKQINGHIILLK
jgi:gliding motility-associated-like protein